MNTSYFAKSHRNPNAISIALSSPNWFHGKEYKRLAPTWPMLNKYKEGKNEDEYTKEYMKILNCLNARQVYDDLGENAVLLCWEAPNRFCHRKLVAEWFQEKLGVEVIEI